MTERIINSEWSRLAEDDGTIGLKYFEFDVVIGGDDAGQITTSPTNISYSPSINKAKDITLDVPPLENLEDLTYLGEPIRMYVDRELAFFGEIKEIQTSQKEGDDYTIYGQPFGKKLNGSDVERTVNNEIVSDAVAKLVDRFNVVADEHENMVGTGDETLNNVESVGGNVLRATGFPASATYTGVGNNQADITSIYMKAYIPSDENITLNVIGEAQTDTKVASGLDKNSYGEWIRFSGFTDRVDSYDLEFLMGSNCLLIDWIVVLREDLKRDVTPPDVNVVEEDTDFYSYSGTELEDNEENIGDGLRHSNGRPATRQISVWSDNPFPDFTGDDEFEDGTAGRIAYGTQATEWDLDNPSNSIEEWNLYARVKPFELFVNRTEEHTLGNTVYDESWSGSASPSTNQIAVEDSSVEVTGDCDKAFQWHYESEEQFGDLTFTGQTYLNDDTPNIDYKLLAGAFSTGHDNEDGYGFIIDSNEITLERYDDGSPSETIDTDTSYSAQANEWIEWEIVISGDDISVDINDSNGSYNLNATDGTHTIFSEFAVETSTNHYIDDLFAEAGPVGGFKNADVELNFDGNLQNYGLSMDAPYREWNWHRIASHDFASNFPDSFSSSQVVNIGATVNSETAFIISPLMAVHRGEQWQVSDFDTTVDEANGYLDAPPLYANGEVFGNKVTFTGQVSEENIFKSTVQADITNTSNVMADWGASQVIDGSTTDFPPPANALSDEQDYPYPGVQHLTQIALSASGERDNASPRMGFQEQRLDSIDVTISTSDLGILFDHDFSNNRLALMNSIAGESSVLFRWEGDMTRIFHRGQETTDVNLNSENISSSVSIEDVYRYCEVIGLHNVRSGLIQSSNAPDYVDDTKIIRDETIENETDAVNRARQFLSEHGTIKFKGEINTKPTFAPLGAELDGSLFNHGQDMIINGVNYGKRSTTISLGHSKDIATELISLETSSAKTRGRATGRGMKIPVGQDQI